MGKGSQVNGKREGGDDTLANKVSQQTSRLIPPSKHRDLLDIVDRLRSSGVNHYVDLPQIIVCGSQSSGKSSTLESISGIAFPTSEGLCTRFATELVLRRSDDTGIVVHINPGASRTEAEKAELAKFDKKSGHYDDIGSIIEDAKVKMGLTGAEGGKKFSDDVLRIECLSPVQPNLTIVDLPGLFGAGDKNQTDEDAEMVEKLVVGYMRQRRSIILAVVSADNPLPNQPVTRFSRRNDPSGTRTLGLITKPDKLDADSENQRYYVETAQNQNVKLTLGWHVLRNRGFDTSRDTAEERDRREDDFFADSVWSDLEPSQLGVKALRERLREVLWRQIRDGMPGVKSDVQAGIADCRQKLRQLGTARDTRREKHTYLLHISAALQKLVKEGIDGVYADRFFESLPSTSQAEPFGRRLRAHVQRILSEFADEMRRDGHKLEVVEDDMQPVRASVTGYVRRARHLNTVKELMEQCRGRELPGTYNPLVVGDLFSRQCRPWDAISQRLVEKIHQAAATSFGLMIASICDQNTTDRLVRGLIQPSLHALRAELKAKVDAFLAPHLSVHPITYNDYLTATVQEIQSDRHQRRFDACSERLIGLTAESAPVAGSLQNSEVVELLQELRHLTEPNVEEYTASLVADVASAYYVVALKKFIDDISVNAVETCLIQRLPEVFCPEVVWDLLPEQIELLGSENDETIKDRADLKEKLRVLEEGLRELDAFTARSGTSLSGSALDGSAFSNYF